MFENFDLNSVLEEPTQQRSETTTAVHTEQPEISSFSGLEFEPAPEPIPEAYDEPIEIEVPYDAEMNAEILVDLIDNFNTIACTPLARWKLRKRQGGKKELARLQLLLERHLQKEELEKEDLEQVAIYKAYLKDKEELEAAIPYTRDEKESLKKAAIPYMKQTKMKIGGGAAFWTQLAFIQGSRIMSILTA